MQQPNTKTGLGNRLALANLVLVAFLIAAERFPGEKWWPTLLLVHSPQVVWVVPSVLLLGHFGFRRRWGLAAGSAVLAWIVLTVLVGARLFGSMPQGPSRLRVLTWNLYFGKAGPSVEELASKTWPDVICLQEAEPWADTGVPKLLDLPQFHGWHARVCGELVILSRFHLKRLGTTHSGLWVSADVDGEKVVIANIHMTQQYARPKTGRTYSNHFYAARAVRSKQTKQILARLPADGPAIVCGDFNTPPNSKVYRILTSVLTDSFRRAGRGLGLTYFRQFPLVHIDHVLVTGALRPIRCWTPEIDASNHRPVCADFALSH